jgi:transcription antitermination factor NusG
MSPLNLETTTDKPLWYAIYTNAREEGRAESNLNAWGVKTFVPKLRGRRRKESYGKPANSFKHLFPRYIFAQFESDALLHKVNNTRGVRAVVGFGDSPCPVDELIIKTIKSQVGEDGFINLDVDFRTGDNVVVKGGAFDSFHGTVEHTADDGDRLAVLLSSISYQGRLMIEKALVEKVAHLNN